MIGFGSISRVGVITVTFLRVTLIHSLGIFLFFGAACGVVEYARTTYKVERYAQESPANILPLSIIGFVLGRGSTDASPYVG